MSDAVPPPGARIGLLDDEEEELTVVDAPAPAPAAVDFLRGIVFYCVVVVVVVVMNILSRVFI